MLLSVDNFATAVGLTRQGIYKAIKTGVLEKTGAKIDADSELTKLYIKSDSSRKKAWMQYCETVSNPVKTGEKQEKPAKKVQKSDKVVEQKAVLPPLYDEETDHFGDVKSVSPEEVIRKTQFARLLREQETVIAKKFENQEKRNEWCDRQKVLAIIPSFVSKVHSGAKIVAETTLSDIGVRYGFNFKNEDYKLLTEAMTEMVNFAIDQVQNDIKNENL